MRYFITALVLVGALIFTQLIENTHAKSESMGWSDAGLHVHQLEAQAR